MRTKDVSQKGFTVVELLIAAVIISVGILAWAKTQQGGIKGRATSDSVTTASELAMSIAEELALESRRSAVPAAKIDSRTVRGVVFNWNGAVTPQQVMTGVWVRSIDVTVNWNQYGPKQVRYQRVTSGG
jgi:prepilin-type N-terminal cleavage/methylation domain-containing protein